MDQSQFDKAGSSNVSTGASHAMKMESLATKSI
jgi:hypothetical protein